QAVDTVHTASGVDHRAHAAGCGRMGASVDDAWNPLVDCRSVVEIGQQRAVDTLDFSSYVRCERRVCENLAHDVDPVMQSLEIAFVAAEVQIDIRIDAGIGGRYRQAAASE